MEYKRLIGDHTEDLRGKKRHGLYRVMPSDTLMLITCSGIDLVPDYKKRNLYDLRIPIDVS